MRNERTRIKTVISEALKSDKPVVAEKITENPTTPDTPTIK